MKLVKRVAVDYGKVIVVTMVLIAVTFGIYGVYKLFSK